VPVASILSGVTDAVTSAIGDHGLYAVFLLMMIDAVFPAASEVVMIYAGALAAGAFTGQDVVLFEHTIDSGLGSYVAVALAGTLGSTAAGRTSSGTGAGSISTASGSTAPSAGSSAGRTGPSSSGG
jgi:predicted metal-binding membrane protein